MAQSDPKTLMDRPTEAALRRYARGEVTSRSLRDETGLDYSQVLAGLGRLGLRPPIARLDGINGPALREGVAFVTELLKAGRR